jgi:hypothetical protein
MSERPRSDGGTTCRWRLCRCGVAFGLFVVVAALVAGRIELGRLERLGVGIDCTAVASGPSAIGLELADVAEPYRAVCDTAGCRCCVVGCVVVLGLGLAWACRARATAERALTLRREA